MFRHAPTLRGLLALLAVGSAVAARPNLVYILLDDLDVLLGSEQVLQQTQTLLSDAGARFTHFRTHSPKCGPSRTGQLVGRYLHNVRPAGKQIGLNQSSMFGSDGLFPQLHAHGYMTSIVGKVHNNQGKAFLCGEDNRTDIFTHISTQCKPCGGYWHQDWVVKDIGDTHPRLETLDLSKWGAYSHAQYGNRSIAFIRQAVKAGQPFFAYIGTTGPHLPAIPAPWHLPVVHGWNATVAAPRTPNFNRHMPTHHPTIAGKPAISDLAFVDQHMRDRWGTLLSIDDLVAGVVSELASLGVLDNTYILFSSDHGYHLGQNRLPMEKMWPYETDVRIPFYIRGPGIAPGTVRTEMAMNIDIAPTLLDAAGITVPPTCDGKSLLPLVTGTAKSISSAGRRWRTRTVIGFAQGMFQYWGDTFIYGINNTQPGVVNSTVYPPFFAPDGQNYTFCNPEDQWRMLRVSNGTDDFAYVEWDPAFTFDQVAFHAFFDVAADPWQMNNTWGSIGEARRAALHAELVELFHCKGTPTSPSNCP